MNKIVLLGLSLAVASTVNAKPNMPKSQMEMMHAIIKKAAGPKGYFAPDEQFPKDYMLIHKNLPYLAGLTLTNPQSSTLGLDKDQLAKLQKIAGKTVPAVLKAAKEIKDLELQLSKEIGLKYKSKPAKEYDAMVDKIGTLRIALSKAHLRCIESVKAVLTEQQYAKLLKYAGKKAKKAKPNPHSAMPHELLDFIHVGMMVKLHQKDLNITQKQTERFDKEIIEGIVPKIQKAMARATELEGIIKKGVYVDHKNAQALKPYMDELAKKKEEASNDRIEAYQVLENILTPEQFAKGMKILQQK